jgi:DNA-binding NarL/FixJ family response regulator
MTQDPEERRSKSPQPRPAVQQPTKIRILLGDDTWVARVGWRAVLETEPDFDIVGEVTVAQDVVPKVEELRPNVVLLDLRWSQDDSAGAIVIQELRQRRLPVKIIAITGHERLIPTAREVGADAAITKEFSRADLLVLIRTLARRESNFPSASRNAGIRAALTTRELDVLKLLAFGGTDRSIANELSIAESTAKNHVQNILSKLNANNRMHAVHLARAHNLLE